MVFIPYDDAPITQEQYRVMMEIQQDILRKLERIEQLGRELGESLAAERALRH